MSALQPISALPFQLRTLVVLPIISLVNSSSFIQNNFPWIPSQSDIINNEIVDTIATTASSSASSFQILLILELISTILRSTIDDRSYQYLASLNHQISSLSTQLHSYPWYLLSLPRLWFVHNCLLPHLKRINLAKTGLMLV